MKRTLSIVSYSAGNCEYPIQSVICYNALVLASPRRSRIALNAQLLRLNEGYRSAGIARYIFHLLCALPRAASHFDLHVFTSEPRASSLLPGSIIHPTRWPTAKPIARILWEQLALPLQLARRDFALHHALAFVAPSLNNRPSVVTVYDLSFVLYPEYFRALNRTYLRVGTRRSVMRARRVIAISESTKRDLVRLWNVPAEKIDVIPPGVEPGFFANGDVSAVERFRRAKNLPDHFILFVGTLEPRKNIPLLVRAFAELKRRTDLQHRLVIAGGSGWKDEAVARTIEETGLKQDIILPGFIPQAELRLWYRAADVFVYPSQYEGFGMPPLEALAAGTPVVTTNVSSLPEAVGEGALLFDPGDQEHLEECLERVLHDRTLREQLRTKGRAHAERFTWDRAAEATVETYRRALGMETE